MGSLYRLYIDESGDHTYNDLGDPSKRYLGITGIIFKKEEYVAFAANLEHLKVKHFSHDPDEPLIFTRSAITNKRGLFGKLNDPTKEIAFNTDILALFRHSAYRIITVVIDKKAHIERYDSAAWHPYHYGLMAMLERYCGFLKFKNARGDVIAEARGKREDDGLRLAFSDAYLSGTWYYGSQFFKNTLTSPKLKLKPKEKNIAGLQLSDLLAYPTKNEILLDHKRIKEPGNKFWRQITEAIANKYNNRAATGVVSGYGKIFLK